MNAPITLSTLATALLAAKSAEAKAHAERIKIEEAIVSLLPPKDEGTVSEKLDGLKITVTHKLTRKTNTIALRTDWAKLPAAVQVCFIWKADVTLSELRRASPETLAEISNYLTTAPAKPSVAVEVE